MSDQRHGDSLVKRGSNEERHRRPAGSPPWDAWNGARVGLIAGGIAGGLAGLAVGWPAFGAVLGAGIGGWIGYRSQR